MFSWTQLQRRDQIRHADVHGIFIRRAADFRDIEEAKNVEAVIDGDLHDIVMPRHLRAFVRGQFVRRAEAEPAAVHVEHHRALAGQARRPDVQLEHVLALPAVVPVWKGKSARCSSMGAGFAGSSRRRPAPGYSSVHGVGGLAGSQRFSPAVVWPYGTPLNVKTPPSRNPRTLPYCVFAIAERGVEQLPGPWWAAVLTLSEANADLRRSKAYACRSGKNQRLAARKTTRIYRFQP